MFEFLNLQLFADAGTLVNATGNYINAGTGSATAFSGTNDLSAGMKTFYDTAMLENNRDQLIFAQLGRKQVLPAKHGKIVEWRKWNTLPDAAQLTEGVIPTGQKFGETSMTVTVTQYGEYVALTDQIQTHAVDDIVLGATEELGSACGKTYDKLVRDVLKQGTNILYADAYDSTGYKSTPSSRATLITAIKTNSYRAYLTPDMVNKAVTQLRKAGAPTFSGGKYLCVLHPSCTYDLRSSKDWIEAHKYAKPEEMFNGEIGELHGVRFVESNLAPVIKADGETVAVYDAIFLGKDAFGVVDPEGAGMETIIKDKSQVGGPLNQFSTVGCKFSMGAKILYQERLLILECCSSYSLTDVEN